MMAYDYLFQLPISIEAYRQLQQIWDYVGEPVGVPVWQLKSLAQTHSFEPLVEFLESVNPDDYNYALTHGTWKLNNHWQGDVILSRGLSGYYGTQALTNVPWTCIQSSPTGFDWGYGGSGPHDLALNILNQFFPPPEKPRVECYVKYCSQTAWHYRHDLCRDIISGLSQEDDHVITKQLLLDWFQSQEIEPTVVDF